MKINLGCASRLLEGYLNVDLDSFEDIVKRYPGIDLDGRHQFLQADMFALPFDDSSVTEILCESMLEHLPFKKEPLFFMECKRLLCQGGELVFSVPDFEELVKIWLAADDDWRDFYRDDPQAIREQHWFGQYSYSYQSRWGYLTASIFGPQNSDGQFHHNCYTEGKLRAMLPKVGFEIKTLDRYLWKGDRDPMLRVVAVKV